MCLNNFLPEYYEFGHVYNVLVKPYEPRVENEVKLLLRCRRGRYAHIFSYALTAEISRRTAARVRLKTFTS